MRQPDQGALERESRVLLDRGQRPRRGPWLLQVDHTEWRDSAKLFKHVHR